MKLFKYAWMVHMWDKFLCSVVDDFKKAKVLVVGDVVLDRFVYGKVDRISPEAPVPVLNFFYEKEMLGGAGNVAVGLAALGCNVTFLGVIGDNGISNKISQHFSMLNINSRLLKLKNYTPPVKIRMLENEYHFLRVDREEILPDIESLLPCFRRLLYSAIENADIVLVSDYNKGLIGTAVASMIFEACQKYEKSIIVDSKSSDYCKFAGALLIKPNLKELSELTGKKYDLKSANVKNAIIAGAKTLFEKFKIQNLLVTLSENGMIFIPSNSPENAIHILSDAKEVRDVLGAGDTLFAALGASLAVGAGIEDVLKLSNIAAGIAVGKPRTAVVTAEELKSALLQKEVGDGRRIQKKIITLDQAKRIVRDLKDEGKKIGFTNGCFDCCHAGHLSSFIQTKKLCDVLIVAMNSDSSVKRCKGKSRPIQDEKTRSLLLASLEVIDYVIVFDEDTPLHIVEVLKPDIVAKEGYTLDKWSEGQLAESYGGKAVILQRLKGYSTSNLIKNEK